MSQKFKILLFLIAGLISVLLIIYGLNVYPMVGGDSLVFIPPAYLYSKGQGLLDPIYGISKFTDPAHAGRFNYYVPLFPVLLGFLTKIKPGVNSIFFVCSLISCLNLFLFTNNIIKVDLQRNRNIKLILIILAVFYVATYLMPTVGRPESLSMLIIYLIYIVYTSRKKLNVFIFNVLLCLLFSSLLATQIVGFYFCFLFYLISELLENNIKYLLVNTIIMSFFIGILFCIILALSPNGLGSTIVGIGNHIKYVFTRTDNTLILFLKYYVISQNSIGFLFLFIISSIIYVKILVEKLKYLNNKINIYYILFVGLLIIFGIEKFILYAAPAVYNVTQYILPVMIFLLFNLDKISNKRMNSLANATICFVCVLGTLVFFRWLILFIFYEQDQKDFNHATLAINEFIKKNDQDSLLLDEGLWPICDNLTNMKYYKSGMCKKNDLIIFPTANHPFPAELENKCKVVYDWSSNTRKFCGMKISNRPQNYGFIVCQVN